jgi:hypothetical protein
MSITREPDARFILEDGSHYDGFSFGANVPVSGNENNNIHI